MHLEALGFLGRFSQENIELICPLSYGVKQKAYFQKVMKTGSAIFGDRFKPLTGFLEPEKYTDFLNNIDIAVMNHNRQEALGNVISLLYLGKKVYLKPGTSSYEYFDQLKVKIFNINNIEKQTFEEFSALDHSALKQNAVILKKELSFAHYKEWWKEIINLA